MTAQHIIGNATNNETAAFIVTKESMTKAKAMLQACLEQSAPLIENGVIKGYSNDFTETDVSAFIASIDTQLNSASSNASTGKPSPYLVSLRVLGGEIEVRKCVTVLSADQHSAFEQAVREETGDDEACVTGKNYCSDGGEYAYCCESATLLTEAEYTVFKKHSL